MIDEEGLEQGIITSKRDGENAVVLESYYAWSLVKSYRIAEDELVVKFVDENSVRLNTSELSEEDRSRLAQFLSKLPVRAADRSHR